MRSIRRCWCSATSTPSTTSRTSDRPTCGARTRWTRAARRSGAVALAELAQVVAGRRELHRLREALAVVRGRVQEVAPELAARAVANAELDDEPGERRDVLGQRPPSRFGRPPDA